MRHSKLNRRMSGLGPKADMEASPHDVRFTLKSGHWESTVKCALVPKADIGLGRASPRPNLTLDSFGCKFSVEAPCGQKQPYKSEKNKQLTAAHQQGMPPNSLNREVNCAQYRPSLLTLLLHITRSLTEWFHYLGLRRL